MAIVGPRLCFCKQGESRYICGNGNSIEFRNSSPKSVKKSKIFDENGFNTYGILADCTNYHDLVCFGERELVWIKDYRILHRLRFSDWISAVKILGDGSVVVLTSHNVLFHYGRDGTTLKEEEKVELEGLGILFCAVIAGDLWENLTVYCGNVFGDVVSFKRVDHEWNLTPFKGHKGMIFGIYLHDHHLYSISDDRSLTVWNTDGEVISKGYGHSARPLALTVSSDGRIFTGGYDEMICIWEFDGELKLKQSIQVSGGPIRSLLAFEDALLAGTATGSLIQVIIPKERYKVTENKLDFTVRSLCRLDDDNSVFINDSRELVLYRKKGNGEAETTVLISKAPLKFNTLSRLGKGMEVIVAEENRLYYVNASKPLYSSVKLYYSVISLILTGNYVLISDEKDECHVFEIKNDEPVEIGNVAIPSRHRISSGFDLGEAFILGTTKGTILVVEKEGWKVSLTVPKAHKKESILFIEKMNDKIVSLGKDGSLTEWSYSYRRLEMICVRATIEWPCKVVNNGEYSYLIGFHGGKFVIVNMKTFLIESEVHCGGGHRIWWFDVRNMTFEYIQKGILYTAQCYSTKIDFLEGPFHSSETTVLAVIDEKKRENTSKVKFVTGGNDTKVILNEYDQEKNTINVLQVSERPLSSVHNVTSCDNLVVTVGGRGEVICWSVEGDELIFLCSKCFPNDFRLISVDICQRDHGYSLAVLGGDGVVTLLYFNSTVRLIKEIAEFKTEEIWSFVDVKFLKYNQILAINTVGEVLVYCNGEENSRFLVERNPLSVVNAIKVEDFHLVFVGSVSGTLSILVMKNGEMQKGPSQIIHVSTITDIHLEKKNDSVEIITISLDRTMVITEYDFIKSTLEGKKIVPLVIADPSKVVKIKKTNNALVSGYGLESIGL
ncbi:unnamed protein product [Bursaphelenchus xylophilus]|uniref:tRNA (34-2'-O)-methyltransferase regulator WDR6 n=1 Tax=Bursaphelenchus xylophilus TaxID=6326 RepID=A0A1I7RKU0_BURXY|nr:unnamed protein product [Bursaphelenchus xylophilus]CAG9131103.1 unnamed protein product [Bursaphelenchus xylophilus]